jgi:site-specific recombinase
MTIHSLTPLTKLVLYSVMYGLWQVLSSDISAWMSASSSLLSSRSI